MGPLVGETELTEALLQAGKDLLRPYYSTDSIFDLLNVRILLAFSDLVTLYKWVFVCLCVLVKLLCF